MVIGRGKTCVQMSDKHSAARVWFRSVPVGLSVRQRDRKQDFEGGRGRESKIEIEREKVNGLRL